MCDLGDEMKYNGLSWTCSMYGDVKKLRGKFILINVKSISNLEGLA
jgi:hypothetical protein